MIEIALSGRADAVMPTLRRICDNRIPVIQHIRTPKGGDDDPYSLLPVRRPSRILLKEMIAYNHSARTPMLINVFVRDQDLTTIRMLCTAHLEIVVDNQIAP